MKKIAIHLITLPRWFATPFFGSSILLGVVLAEGNIFSLHALIGLVGGLMIMAGAHSFNTILDYWTGLDRGSERSAEKSYTSGQSVIAKGLLSFNEVLGNAIGWYALALVPVGYLAIKISPVILPVAFIAMMMTFFYARGKFNWTHELVLGIGAGPIPVLFGMFSVNPSPPWLMGLVASVPVGVILSFAGLAIDEYPDAEANLKKGVRSIAYKVWEYKVDLASYVNFWLVFIFIYQIFLISVGILAPATAITFILVPFMLGLGVMVRSNFDKFSPYYVISGALYPILLLLGQIIG